MLRISWYKAVTASLLLHCLLLLGVGWKAAGYTLTPKEEQNIEMELALDTNESNAVYPVVSESIVAERVPEEEIAIDSKKDTPERQPRIENVRDVPPAKNEPSAGRVADKNALMLSNYSKEQLDVALSQYNLFLTLNSPIAILYSDRGKVYYDKGEFDKAFADFNQALVLDPHLSAAHIGRGFIYTKRNRWDLALEDFNQAIATSPKNGLAYYGRALCFIKSDDKQKAMNDFRAFIQYATPEYKQLVQIANQMLSELGG
jgi:tetratricopeptide (TPR) repeat protein